MIPRSKYGEEERSHGTERRGRGEWSGAVVLTVVAAAAAAR